MSARSVAGCGWIGSAAMTDERPRPRYGEYAPVAPEAPLSELPPPAPVVVDPDPSADTVPPRRTRDVVITTVLLLLGVYDVVISFSGFAGLGRALRSAFEQQGVEGFASAELANTMGAAINVVRVVLLVIAIVVSLLLIGRGRRAFWVPLAAAAVSALVIGVCVLVVVLSDPGFAQYVAEQTASQ